MPKHPRKRQKTSKRDDIGLPISKKAARMEMLMDDEEKDDEERRLESMLFGTKYVPKEKGKGKMESGTDEDEDDEENSDAEGGRGMQHLLDQDLFFVDDGLAPNQSIIFAETSASGSDSESESNSDNDSQSDSHASSSSTSKRSPKQKSFPKILNSSRSKPPAWTDPSDVQPSAKVSLLSGPTRLRKLRQAVDEDEITGREYETRLREQFERINPEPAWARKSRKKNKGDSDDEGVEGDGEGIRKLLASTSGILAEAKKKGRKNIVIPQGTLAIERVRDANQSVQKSGSGEVKVLAFHPKPSVPVLAVATADRRVRLFNIDGHLSPLLTTLHVPSLPLVSSTSVLFHPEGNTMLLSGPRPFFYTYDLQTGTSALHRRGLWGTGFDDSTTLSSTANTNNVKRRRKAAGATSGGGGKGGGGNSENILHTAFSPSTGSILAVAGRGGNVHLVDWKSGAGQVIGSLKCTSSGGGGGGGVQGLWWVPSSSTDGVLGGEGGTGNDEKHLAVMTGDAEVYIWDVAQRRCVKRWKDEGGYRTAARVLAGGGGTNGYMAIGSSSGFVNVYGSDSFAIPRYSEADTTFLSSTTDKPKLAKALGQLTTPISTLRFNHDAQILAMASKEKKDAMRLVHLPSLTAFGSWPTSSTPLGHVTAVDFSARSEYIAIGNTRGKVLLYHLKDFGAGGSKGVNGF
ncbi:WD40 repeat-like protein [Pholiota conissans]|uniref:WD40 repeat-like protein n=1 Tax=Pholiota conissans TaxID=109636 RepID=A0A9P5Z4G2_9AGAR|nr:WD40 repeat-like protein [Pholiota conissans]